MAWFILVIAGLLEVCWAVGLKYTHGFTRLTPSIFVVVSMILSMVMLSWAIRTLPLGTAYGVWVGIGSLGAAILGIILFKEPASAARLFFIAMLMISIIGLKVTSPTHESPPPSSSSR